MPRWLDRTPRHQAIRAATQKSLLPPQPNTSVNAPWSSTSTPKGVSFSFAGGSWSHPFSALPSLPVRVFPPSGVVAHGDLGLGVDGDLQRVQVAPHFLADRLDVGEDGVRVLGLLQGLTFADAFEPVPHAVEDVTHGPLAGQRFRGVALLDQCPAHLGGGHVGVQARRLQLGVSLDVRLDEGADVRGQPRVLVLAALLSLGSEVLHAADAPLGLVQPRLHGIAAPAEAAFGLAGAALTQLGGNFGHEQATLIALEAARSE